MNEKDKVLIRKIRNRPTYIMVPRKLIVAWITSTAVLFIMVIASFQYSNYVDRKSNTFWCGIVVMFDDTYKETPPPTPVGQKLAIEFSKIRKGYKCK